MLIIDTLQKHLIAKRILEDDDRHAKNSFWCSEAETPLFDLYHKWIGTPPTNPFEPKTMLIFNAGKMMELSLIQALDELDMVDFSKGEQERVDMTRCGVKVTGYIDAVMKDGQIPLEVKSFYGDYQEKEIMSGKPKLSYLKQLAMYIDFKGVDKGRLIYLNRGTGSMYEFELFREKDLKFTCLNQSFDLAETYQRWSKLYYDNILPKIEPPSEFRYKIPVEQIDWSKVSNADISKARNNKKVIGDSWQVSYSAYKNLIIEREGSTLGYTDSEIEYIQKITAGYSSKKLK